MHDQYTEMITGSPLFRSLTLEGARMLLESGDVKQYREREIVIREADSPTFVLLVLTGRMQVFIGRHGQDLILNDTGPGGLLGELAVLCGIPRCASVRAIENAATLQWSSGAFRNLLLREPFLSERIFRESLHGLIEKEKSLIDSLIQSQEPSTFNK